MYSLGILILIAIFLKYVILGILYEDFIHPITVLSALPIATIGGLGALNIFGSSIVSAIPIAIGIGANASLRRPLSLVVVGGLILSELI